VQKLSGKKLVKPEVMQFLGKVSGWMLIVYVLLKAIDTLYWINHTVPAEGGIAYSFYTSQGFGTWILFAEIVFLGLIPALVLLSKRMREKPAVLVGAAFLVCCGIVMNRFVMTIQTLALPTLPFDLLMSYVPSWQEVATFMAVVAYGVLVYSLSFRYMTLFPQERDMRQ
jgi:molybdopterin-containing oxidoreductase family membrane subunit